MISNPKLMIQRILDAEADLSSCLTSPRQARVRLSELTRRERQVVLSWFRHLKYKALRVAGTDVWYLYKGQRPRS